VIRGKKWLVNKHDKRRRKCHKTSPVNLACHFFIHLAVHRYFRLPNLKFGLPFGHWQAAISSPDKEYEKILITRARAKEKL